MNDGQNDMSWNKNPPLLKTLGLGARYFVKTPWWLKKIYPRRLWNKSGAEKIIYLTFDDGPHPVATPFVLDELKKYNATATFFCIGKNVVEQPALYRRILQEGHRAGNHTQQHLNGWSTPTGTYLADIAEAAVYIDSDLFRPPYGRITQQQAKGIPGAMKKRQATIVMWDVLSGDFDNALSKEKCLEHVLEKTGPGSIVVFHDSEKAFPRLEFVLPRLLQYFKEKGFRFEKI